MEKTATRTEYIDIAEFRSLLLEYLRLRDSGKDTNKELSLRSAIQSHYNKILGTDYKPPKYLDSRSPEELRIIFKNLDVIGISHGCSVGCTFCGIVPEKQIKVQAHMPFRDIVYILQRVGSDGARTISPFTATDPLDYIDGHFNIIDVAYLINFFQGQNPFVSTAYPVGSKDKLLELGDSGAVGMRLSVSYMNIKRLLKDGILVDKGDKYEIKPPFSDFFKQVNNFSDKPVGDHRRFDVIKVGAAFDKDAVPTSGIGCMHGLMLDPDESGQWQFVNVVQTQPNDKYPTGEARAQIRGIEDSRFIESTKFETLEDLLPYVIVRYTDRFNNLREIIRYQNSQRPPNKQIPETLLFLKFEGLVFECLDARYTLSFERSTGKIEKIRRIDNTTAIGKIIFDDFICNLLVTPNMWENLGYPRIFKSIFSHLLRDDIEIDETTESFRDVQECTKAMVKKSKIIRILKDRKTDLNAKYESFRREFRIYFEEFDQLVAMRSSDSRFKGSSIHHARLYDPKTCKALSDGYELNCVDHELMEAIEDKDIFYEQTIKYGQRFTRNYLKFLCSLKVGFETIDPKTLSELIRLVWMNHIVNLVLFAVNHRGDRVPGNSVKKFLDLLIQKLFKEITVQ